jgi:hypothetical protein
MLDRGTNPRVVAFHGCSVRAVALRLGGAVANSGAGAGASAAAAARAAVASAASFSRQHCLYFLPEPQWQGSLRPGRELVWEVIGIECTVSLNFPPAGP